MWLRNSRISGYLLIFALSAFVFSLGGIPTVNWLAGKVASAETIASDHWSFQPVSRPTPPETKTNDWARNEIDRFVLVRLEKAGLRPSPQAERSRLICRLSLDLTGLPPAPELVREVMHDKHSDWYERLVDRLLASPHFGERWGRHWLDLARYADSDGYEMDHPRPHAWRWRDWVINAINADMPFDRFTIEQLAGDLLPSPQSPSSNGKAQGGLSQKTATGFHRNTLTNRENGIDKEEFRLKAVVDRVNTTGTVWLGLTLGCAECHSHKYDPITQQEYYQLFAFFNDRVDETDLPLDPSPQKIKDYEQAKAGHDARLAELEAKLAEATEEREEIEKAIKAFKKQAPEPPEPVVHAFSRRVKPRTTHVHLGGNFLEQGSRTKPGTPAVLPPLKNRHKHNQPTSAGAPDRLDLAYWIVDSRNPLTSRVAVNHIWQLLFGTGLVATPEDFGTRGTPPTHPELLDWLATELIRRNWSRKSLIRLIVSSATYRQSSDHRPDQKKIDSDNRLLSRQNRFRLEAEVIRDQYLAACGLFWNRVGGPGFRPPLPDGLEKVGFRLSWKPDRGRQLHRRGMYIFYHRNLAYPMLKTFDFPNSNVACTRRERSNTPLQPLTQLNDPLFIEAARAMAFRLLSDSSADTNERIDRAYLRCLARRPTGSERDVLLRLHVRLSELYRTDSAAAAQLVGDETWGNISAVDAAVWTALSRTIMNLDEFVTRE